MPKYTFSCECTISNRLRDGRHDLGIKANSLLEAKRIIKNMTCHHCLFNKGRYCGEGCYFLFKKSS